MANKQISVIISAKNKMAAGLSAAGASLQKFGQSAKRIGQALAGAFVGFGTAIVGAMKRAETFRVQIAQIATISSISMAQAGAEVRKLSVEFGLAKDELSKGLYDALSAGVPQDNVFEFMRVASKTAKAGAASVAESVDFLTTALNAFKIPASDAGKVADQLFTAVRLGKTTVAELGQSFAVVAPIAAASGVKLNEVLAAVATLTKQGTPTAQAMTQIRAAILAANATLGDGWAQTMSLQGAMGALSAQAGGSATEIQKLTGRVEGAMAVIGLTGQNAAMAAGDLEQLSGAAGAMGEAFEKVADVAPMERLKNALDNVVIAVGNVAAAGLDTTVDGWTGSIGSFAESLDRLGKIPGAQEAVWAQFFEDIKYGFIEILDVAGIAVDGIVEALMLVPRLVSFQWKKIGSNVKSGLDVAEMHAREHADRMEEIARKQAEAQNAPSKDKPVTAAETDAERGMRMMREASAQQDALVKASLERRAEEKKKADAELAKARKKAADEGIKLAEQLAAKEKEIAVKKAEDAIDAMEKAQAKKEEMAAKTVQDILNEQKAQAQAEKNKLKMVQERDRLEQANDPRRGRHLGKQQQAKLDALNAILGAQAGIQPGRQMLDHAKDQLARLNDNGKKLGDIKLAIEVNNKQMKELMLRA